jgi:RNA polymerase sigma-70 factor (ECF subfamily)
MRGDHLVKQAAYGAIILFTDEDLALRIKRGDTDALSTLVERHHGPLVGFLYRMSGGDRALAEDLVQEAFLRVLRAIARYEYPRPFKSWLYAIAANLARDHFKRADTRRTEAVPDEALGQVADEAASPEGRVIAGDEAEHVAAAVAALPDHQRAAVILRYYQGLSLAEIADMLDVPVGTIKSRLSLGLRRLRARLEGIE